MRNVGKYYLSCTRPPLWRKPGDEPVNEVPKDRIRRLTTGNNIGVVRSIERVDDLGGPARRARSGVIRKACKRGDEHEVAFAY